MGAHLRVEGHGRPLCILRHLVSVVEVVAEGRLLVFVCQVRVGAVCPDGHGQHAMHHDVRVSAEEEQRISLGRTKPLGSYVTLH